VLLGGAVGRSLGVGRALGVGVTRGVVLGVAVAVGVPVGVVLGVAVGVGVGEAPPGAQYLPPVFKWPAPLPPQMIISSPVHTAV
jgi:hypothetical protein